MGQIKRRLPTCSPIRIICVQFVKHLTYTRLQRNGDVPRWLLTTIIRLEKFEDFFAFNAIQGSGGWATHWNGLKRQYPICEKRKTPKFSVRMAPPKRRTPGRAK
jgi:hypothetical protein